MSSVLGSETGLRPRRKLHFSLAHALLLVPVVGFIGFFWFVTHHVTKPEISLFDAAEAGDLRAVRDHLATGTPMNELSTSGHTALFLAIQHRKTSVADYLLEHGADVNGENQLVFSPLYIAAGQGDSKLAEKLIEKGADVNAASKNGVTPLHAAADSGDAATVKLLLEHGAKPNGVSGDAKGTPLCNAAEKGDLECVRLLVDHGADINGTGYLGRAPLHLAAARSHFEVVQYLLAKGADADRQDAQGTLAIASSLVHDEDPRVFWLLYRHTTKLNATDFSNGNLLHYAVASNVSMDILKTLISRGLDVNRPNYLGQTPLSIALDNENMTAAKALEAAGARVPLRELIRMALAPPKQPRFGGFMSVE